MKTTIRFFLILSLLSLIYSHSRCCTSFAVYSEETWYGMNFDYPDTPIKLLIRTQSDKKVFRAEFGTGAYIAGININGLFTNYQLLYYDHGDPVFAITNTLSFGVLNDHSMGYLSTVSEVTGYIGDRLLIPSWDLNLHTLFADKTGNAIVAEPFGAVNGITNVQNGFLVMTNFPNYEFIGADYETVYGAGSERYISAFAYIQDHIDDFRYEDGLETLNRTIQPGGEYPTQISLLFDPLHLEIYFCLYRDFSHIWKVSFENGTLETYSGFSGHIIHTLDESGIWASGLMDDVTAVREYEMQDRASGNYRIHPNPAKECFTVDLRELPGPVSTVELYNNLGKRIFIKEFGNALQARIDLTGYPAGVYIVRVLNENGVTAKNLLVE
jgi:hypothetical protein